MSQVVAIDYGKVRCGIAATDDMQLIASALTTVETKNIFSFLEKYFSENKVETLVIGLPTDLKGNLSEIETDILKFIEKVKELFPEVEIHRFDERFTSVAADRSENGISRDEKAAVMILEGWVERNNLN